MRPIRLDLLIHDIEYFKYNGSDEWGEAYDAPILISRVKVDEGTRFNRYSNTETIAALDRIFVDGVHSSPKVDWVEKSKVRFKGKEMTVKVVKTFEVVPGMVHHWEVDCE